jgi:hypothetical protein
VKRNFWRTVLFESKEHTEESRREERIQVTRKIERERERERYSKVGNGCAVRSESVFLQERRELFFFCVSFEKGMRVDPEKKSDSLFHPLHRFPR